ncbi:hypothetical protein [Haliea salexigens]|uniref:hypothetical protein n=1 Tax=Haliea salexigens TaxID=287487 RepID=UPI001182E4AD|nr:hypothetical protein [Haliea salexigens]
MNAKSNPKPQAASSRSPYLGVRLPATGTVSCNEYLASFRQINRFLYFVIGMAGHIEKVSESAHSALLSVEDDLEKQAQMERDWRERRSTIDDLRENRQFFMEVVLVRHVENYLNYLSSLLREIFVSRPETLRSSDKIDLETVLKHDSIQDLVQTVAERKVESLTYSSFSSLEEFFSNRFSLVLVDDKGRQKVIEAIEARNISVHNRCVINQRYISRTGAKQTDCGELKALWIGDVEAFAKVATLSVLAVDKGARKRLKVPGHRFSKLGG